MTKANIVGACKNRSGLWANWLNLILMTFYHKIELCCLIVSQANANANTLSGLTLAAYSSGETFPQSIFGVSMSLTNHRPVGGALKTRVWGFSVDGDAGKAEKTSQRCIDQIKEALQLQNKK